MNNPLLSSDGKEIFDWAISMGNAIHFQCQKNELINQIAEVGKRCGDCEKWMHHGQGDCCPRETPTASGYSRGPSINGFTCKQFIEKRDATEWREELKQRLAKLLETGKTTSTI